MDAKATACQKDVTQKYHNPIADSFVKYTTVTKNSKDTIKGNHPLHSKDGDWNFVQQTDMQPKVHNDKCTNDKTNKKLFVVCTYPIRHPIKNKLISVDICFKFVLIDFETILQPPWKPLHQIPCEKCRMLG